jgi:pseudouridine 5'-phosphatase
VGFKYAQLIQGTERILNWANIPLTIEEWKAKEPNHYHLFSHTQILPGVAELLDTLTNRADPPIQIALASSAGRRLFDRKTSHIPQLKGKFAKECCVFGDDPQMVGKKRKPEPDCFLLAKEALDRVLQEKGERQLDLLECLVFEDSVAGVEAGRNAGMRVIWVPHSGLAQVCKGREQEVLMGLTERNGTPIYQDDGEGDAQVHRSLKSEDERVEMLASLADFPYETYGIKLSL